MTYICTKVLDVGPGTFARIHTSIDVQILYTRAYMHGQVRTRACGKAVDVAGHWEDATSLTYARALSPCRDEVAVSLEIYVCTMTSRGRPSLSSADPPN